MLGRRQQRLIPTEGRDTGLAIEVDTEDVDFDSYRASTIPDTIDSTFNCWDEAIGVTVTAEDLLSLDDTGLLGPRSSDGSLPVTDFARLAPDSDLIDAGIDAGGWWTGTAPDLGCFERP